MDRLNDPVMLIVAAAFLAALVLFLLWNLAFLRGKERGRQSVVCPVHPLDLDHDLTGRDEEEA